MTKARARERAKAKAAQKTKKPKESAEQPDQKKIRPGQFDPGSGSIAGPGANARTKTFAGARRGGARSR